MRARDLFYAMWIPDLFMERVKENGDWTLMCPDECPGLSDCYGDEFKEWEGDLLVTSLKYKMLIKINMDNNQIINETILLKDEIGRIRDVEIDTKGNVYLISDQKKSSLWKLTK